MVWAKDDIKAFYHLNGPSTKKWQALQKYRKEIQTGAQNTREYAGLSTCGSIYYGIISVWTLVWKFLKMF